MKKLLVTGGLGFIGSYFVDMALKRGYYVINVDKKTYAARTDIDFDGRKNYEFIEEFKMFPNSTYKDQVDATSGAFNFLVTKRIARAIGRRSR